ncbi:hypothetical protein D3C84_1175860 [compost metagenome]
MLEKLGIPARDTIFVGDHPVNDVAASRQAGMIGVWKEDRLIAVDFDRDGSISDLMDVISLLEAIQPKET